MDSNIPANIPTSIPALSTMILAVGALGTAAFGLVDAFKAVPGGGVSRFGFGFVSKVIKELLPDGTTTGMSRDKILESLKSQWINGSASVSDQVNIAKSLIKLQLTPGTAPALAKATGVDPALLTQVATCMQSATPLSTQQQSDTNGRFDLALTTLLDQAYQSGEQRYRNTAKACAVVIAVVLSVATNQSLGASAAHAAAVAAKAADTFVSFWSCDALAHAPISMGQAILLGLIATPIAPVAKDIASAVQTASKAIQAWKG